ncbi:gliding motility lipoprotein GldH [Fibrivirga algicola]|uniref:Gliding motility lipoprotein GldH n=1 Tax=Fibrivirga algicola TaxID=2950420 RepID=A0ABX0QFF6_9BACT|nr:gliding motility lipoprotein GldH [Fibrivirga algicola]NID09966.1 gliding motility lipoprotein GldH [Fibrivirga algicola]
MKRFCLVIGLLALLTACEQDPNVVYKENADIENGKWYVKNAPSFRFTITDASIPYDLYYTLRNNLTYPYYNLYLTRYLTDEQGREIESRLDELILMDPKTGEPRGKGLGDLYDNKVLMKRAYRFAKPGTYVMRIKQYMRQDPLPDVVSVGISVEKSEK